MLRYPTTPITHSHQQGEPRTVMASKLASALASKSQQGKGLFGGKASMFYLEVSGLAVGGHEESCTSADTRFQRWRSCLRACLS